MTRKSIILEGLDGTGKSRLGRALSVKFGMTLFTNGPRPKTFDAARKYVRLQHDAMLAGGYVFDRVTPISQVVYSTSQDEESEALYYSTALGLMLAHEPVIIFCDTPDPRPVLENYDCEEAAKRDELRRDELRGRYLDLLARAPRGYLTYDMAADPDYTAIIATLQELL